VRPFGCNFTLTGFDGSNAAMETLREFRPGFVKFGAASIDSGATDPSSIDAAAVTEISRACHDAGSQVIAEFVDDIASFL
jgi:EAL domain-containing protein (putative c-di-GMP-specific phosphodiesterase class I)